MTIKFTTAVDGYAAGSTLDFESSQEAAYVARGVAVYGGTGYPLGASLGQGDSATGLAGPDGVFPLNNSDAAGRLTKFVGLKGNPVTIAYAGGRVQTVANDQPPWMYLTANGPVNFMHQNNIRGHGFGVDGNIYCISASDKKFYKYSNGAWSGPLSAAIDASGGVFATMYMDSRGYLFASWEGSSSRSLYRSVDGGATWAAVITSTDLPDANDFIGMMTEADNGYLFATGYNGVASAGTAVNKLFRSTDGGATWSVISGNFAFAYNRHIHAVLWDRFRNCLWVSGGDSNNQYLQCSTDYGVTWASWLQSSQATGIIADADYIYYCSDLSGDHGIYRARGATAAAILASTPRRVAKITDVAGTDGTEFAWWGDTNAQGQVFFTYSKGAKAAVLASSDQGLSWTDVFGTTIASTTNFGSQFVQVSKYKSGWSGFYYSLSNTVRYTIKWRVYPSNMRWLVDNAAGDDFGDGIVAATKTIPEYGIKPNAVVKLTAPYTANAALGFPGLVLDSNGQQLGSAVSGSLVVNETFEGVSSLTASAANSGTVDQVATANPFLINGFAIGTKHARCVTAAVANSQALIQKVSAGGASGDTIWMSGQFSLATVTITSAPYIMQINGAVSLYIDTSATIGGGLMVQTAADSRFYRQLLDEYVTFPQAAYVAVKMAVYLHATQGEIRVWQAGRLVLHVKGVNTIGSYAGIIRWGLLSAQVLTLDIDNAKAAINVDPDLPPAYSLNGPGQYLLRECERSEY